MPYRTLEFPSTEQQGPDPMPEQVNVPPIFRLHVLAPHEDAIALARAKAVEGVPPASLYWCGRPDRLSCAIVLEPEQALREAAQMVFIGQLGLGDALSSALPPLMDVGLALPDEIVLDRAVVGRVQLFAPPGQGPEAVPDWLVLAAEVAVSGFPADNSAGGKPVETTLEHDNCGAVSSTGLVGAFARHLLSWIDRWQRDGFDPVRTAWLHRGHQHDQALDLSLEGGAIAGTFSDLSEEGDIIIDTAAGKEAVPAWRLLR
jgi:BirA family transcriptional regulator, biotin operon repressor / biotin---[acetyl-CoA-carboxylase] ligase